MKIKKGLLIQEMGDSYVAYDNETSTLHELNETAYVILSGIEKKKTKDKILKEIVKRYKVSAKEAEKDLEKFIQLLSKKDLIVSPK